MYLIQVYSKGRYVYKLVNQLPVGHVTVILKPSEKPTERDRLIANRIMNPKGR